MEQQEAMTSRFPSPANTVGRQLTGSTSCNPFPDPVTQTSGPFFKLNDTMLSDSKNYSSRTPEFSIAPRNDEQINKRKLKPGEVPCDVCTTMAATKSCLVCLASYCDDHLSNHSSKKRFTGHKLVRPVPDLDQRACMTHGRPLELYSRLQEKCICVLCAGEEGVVSTEDEWNNKKAKLQKTIKDLQEKIKDRKTKMDEINASVKSCTDQLEREWWEIDSVFTAVMAIVEAAQAKALKPLQDRRQLLKKEATEFTNQLQTEMDKLEQTISELQKMSNFEDHILFLQRYPSLKKEPGGIKDWTAVELDTSLSFGSMRKVTESMMKQIQVELDKLTSTELQRLQKFTVDVKLDPGTSHRRLVVSSDRKEVSDGEIDQEVDDSLRFDFFCSILGVNKFSSGRSYWEVEVGNKSAWDLGVASAKANRKGKLTLSPDNGYWAIVHYEEDKYAALTAPPIHLGVKDKPQKVGVFLDYEEGLVSFYNVTAQTHIHSFSDAAFSEELLPYFSPHVKDEKNTEPLVISPV